jgi:hypothetical protein
MDVGRDGHKVRGTLAFVFFAAMLASTGCAVPTIREASRQATAGALDQGLGVFEDERTRRRVTELMATPEMQQAMRDVAAGFTNGVTGALSTDETMQRIALLTNVVAATAARAVVDTALAEAASADNQRRMETMAAATATAATHAAMQAMSTEMVAMAGELGPAVRTAMNEDVGPSVRNLFRSPEIRGALGGAAFEMSRQAVLGSNEALAELEQRKKKTGLIARASGVFAQSAWLLPLAFAVFLATIIVLVVWLARTRAQARHYRNDIGERSHDAPSRARRHLLHRRHRPADVHS